MKSNILMLRLICNACGSEHKFSPSHYHELGFSNLPKVCPTCRDVQIGAQKKVVDRECLAYFPSVRLDFFVSNWGEMRRHDLMVDSMLHQHWDEREVCSRYHGGLHSGDLTLYSREPYERGDVVSIRHMRVRNEFRPTIEQVELAGERVGELALPGRSQEYEYWVLAAPETPTPQAALGKWEAYHKHTLKGYGAVVDQDEAPLPELIFWEKSFYTGYRSGRAWCNSRLIIYGV